MSEIRIYKKNLTDFVSSLPKTNLSFLHYVRDDVNESGFIPCVNTCAREWHEPNVSLEPMYVIPSIQGGTFYHVYRESLLKKDHVSIGLEKSFANGEIILMTRTTTDIPNSENPAEFQRDAIKCNVFLTETLNATSACIQGGKPDGRCLGFYDNETLAILEAWHSILWNGISSQRVTKDAALEDRITGGFDASFVDFFQRVVLDAIVQLRPDLTEAILVDEGLQGEEDHLMVRYVFGDSPMSLSHLFAVDHRLALGAWRIHQKPTRQRSAVESQTMTRFVDVFRGALVRV